MFKNPMLSNQVRPMHLLNPQEMKIYTQLQQQLYMGTLPPHCIRMYVYLEAFHPDVNVGNKVSVVNAPSNLTVSDTNPLVYVRRSTNTKPVDYIITNDQQDTNKNLSIQVKPNMDTNPVVYVRRSTNQNTVDYIITNDQQDTTKNLSIQVKPNMLISTDFKSNKNIKQLAKEANCFNAVKVIRETEYPSGCIYVDENKQNAIVCHYGLEKEVKDILMYRMDKDVKAAPKDMQNLVVALLKQQHIVNNKHKGEWQKIRNGLKGMYNIMDYADAVNHVIQTTEQVKKAIRFYEDGRLKDKNARLKKAIKCIKW